jgi:thiol:disulfide interchange protein DsbD
MKLSIAFTVLIAFLPAVISAAESDGVSSELFVRAQGSQVKAVLRLAVKPGWHLYHDDLGNPDAIGLPTVVSLQPENLSWSKVVFPPPHRLEQYGLGTWINSHSGTILLYAQGVLPPGEDLKPVTAKVTGQTCSDAGACVQFEFLLDSPGRGDDALFANFPDKLNPETTPEINQALTTQPAKAESDYTAVAFPDFQPRAEASATRGFLLWLAVAFLAGLLMNLMPCVLPVVMLKVMSLAAQAGESKGRILLHGLAFGGGMLAVYWVLAGLTIFFGLTWGEQFQSSEFMIILIAALFAFALSLFGVYEFGVPATLNQLAASGQKREGLGGAFLKGALATVLATPCSGPLLGGTLAWTLKQGAPTLFAVFTLLGIGMAMPYVLLPLFPVLRKLIPKPGEWMVTFKQAMGFVMIFMVLYLMMSLRQDLLLFTNLFLLFVGLAAWVWGRYGNGRVTVAAVALALLLLGAQISFRNVPDFLNGSEGRNNPYEEFEPEKFKELLASGHNVFLEFEAQWCSNCKLNKKLVYESDGVVALLKRKNVAVLRADMTHRSARTEMLHNLRARLGGQAVPYLAVFPADDSLHPYVRPDLVSRSDIEEILNKLPEGKQ